MNKAEAIIGARYPGELASALLTSFREIEANFVMRKWKASELDAGHFVEAVRRILELELTTTYTPVGTPLPRFTDGVLKAYENATGDESYRILIPRILKGVFNVRNKRGVGHLGGISPNEMDATLILYSCKWVLAELVRLASGLSPADTQTAVDEIVERRLALIWKAGDVVRVVKASVPAREQVLVLLYDRSPQTADALRAAIEYQNPTKFRSILKALHRKRLIFVGEDGQCLLMPPGLTTAELVLRRVTA